MDVNNFTGVPPTTLVHCEHPNFNYSSHMSDGRSVSQFPKLGSLQTFVDAEGSFEDYGDNMFSDFEVQKLALFDIRTLNCDRNASNILLQRKRQMRSGSVDEGAAGDLNSTHGAAQEEAEASLSSWENGYDYKETGLKAAGATTKVTTACLAAPPGAKFAETERRAQSSRARGQQPKDRHHWCQSTTATAALVPSTSRSGSRVPPAPQVPVNPKIKDYLLSIDLDKMRKELELRVSMSEESLFLIRLTQLAAGRGRPDTVRHQTHRPAR